MLTIILLSALILLHELGHFLMARKFGVKVEEFGIGIPPKAMTLGKKGDTEYTLNWLPLGGFVRLFGEDGDMSVWEKLNPFERRQAFSYKPVWQRALILLSGITMNFLTGILLFSIIYTISGIPKFSGNQVVLTEVAEGSPADLGGIKANEVVKKVGETTIDSAEQFVATVNQNKGTSISLYLAELQSDGTVGESYKQVSVIPREDPPEGEGALGVGVSEYPILSYEKKPWYTAPFYGAVEGVKEAYGWTSVMVSLILHPSFLWQNISGPVEVVKIGQKSAGDGLMSFLRFGGIISFNLAVFNLLPFPALDGGRLLFLGIEKIVGKKRVGKYEKYVNAVGMIALLLLMVVVTVRDFIK